jgi:hypothetical protein
MGFWYRDEGYVDLYFSALLRYWHVALLQIAYSPFLVAHCVNSYHFFLLFFTWRYSLIQAMAADRRIFVNQIQTVGRLCTIKGQ